MKRLSFILVLIVFCCLIHAQTEDWLWAVRAGGVNHDNCHSIASDDNGNCYVTGYFENEANFGTINLPGINSFDIYIAKLSSDGNWLWARAAGGSSGDMGYSITTDIFGNNISVGSFNDTANLGNTSLTSNGGADVYVTKLDTNGNWLWANQAGGSGPDKATGVSTDANANIYIAGEFSGVATFGNTQLNNFGFTEADIFVAKLDANGNWLWAVSAGGIHNDICEDIVTDSFGNSYIVGGLYGAVTFGSITLISQGLRDIFVAKIDPDGNWLWAKRAGGLNHDQGYGITADGNGNCYISGNIIGTANFGDIVVNSNSISDVYVAKIDPQGNFLWVSQAQMQGGGYGYGIAADNIGNCFVTGCYSGTATFGSTSIYSESNEAFIAKLNGNGNWVWAKSSAGGSGIYSSRVSQTNYGYSYIAGYLYGPSTFGYTTLSSSGGGDIFVAKLGSPSYTITNPNGGEQSVAGKPYSVTWNTDHSGAEIDILLSVNIGVDWNLLNSEPVTASESAFTFTLPFINSDECLVKIVNTTNSIWYDVSDGVFSIHPYPLISTQPFPVIDFGNEYVDYQSEPVPLWIKNNGTADLTISSISFGQANSPFSLLDRTLPIAIAQGDSVCLSLVFFPQMAGLVMDNIHIHNNSLNMPVCTLGLRGTGVYVPPNPPEGLEAVMYGNNYILNWEAVTQTVLDTPIVPDYYLVFYNGSSDPGGLYYFHGATPNLTYTHCLVGLHAQNMFYRVRAYKFYDRQGLGDLVLLPGMPESEVLQILAERGYTDK